MKRLALLPLALAFVGLACNSSQNATPTPVPPTALPATLDPNTPVGDYLIPFNQKDGNVAFFVPSGWDLSESDGILTFQNPSNAQKLQLYTTDGSQARNAQDQFRADLGLEQPNAAESFTLSDGDSGWLSKSGNWWLLTTADNLRAYHLLFTGDDGREPDTADTIRASFRAGEETQMYIDRSTTVQYASGELETLDPALTHSGGSTGIGDLFSGLVVLDPSLQVRPALAERWEVSPDGRTYTFYLRKNARFHNGRPITTQDVLASWERAASPALGSDTVMAYMNDILGLPAYHAGTAEHIAGITLTDDYTMQVQLDEPKAYFLAKLTYPVSWVVDRYQTNFPDWEEHPNGSGPFRQVQHIRDTIFVLAPSPYADPMPQVNLSYLMYAGYGQSLYQNDEVDLTGVSRDQIGRAENPKDLLYGTLQSGPSLCTYYVNFDTQKPPFDDVLVRQAFAHLVDLQRYHEAIADIEDPIARGLLPPGMPGSSEIQLPDYNPEKARQLLAQSKYASNLPELVWTIGSSDSFISGSAALLAAEWQRELGVKIRFEAYEWQSYYDFIEQGKYGQILSSGWCADYPDPENFLDTLFHKDAPQNKSHYDSPAYTALIEQARVEQDVAKRLALYHQAEQLLVDEAPAIFLSHAGPSYWVWKPHIQGYIPSPIGVPQNQLLRIVR